MSEPAPPSAVESEEEVVYAIVSEPGACAAVVQIVDPLHFFDRRLGLVYAIARALFRQGAPTDAAAVVDRLRRYGKDRKLAEDAEVLLGEIRKLGTIATVHAAEHHARLVRDAWVRRKVGTALRAAAEATLTGTADGEAALDAATAAIVKVQEEVAYGRRQTFSGVDLASYVEEKWRTPVVDAGSIPTPWPTHLDALRRGSMLVLGGRTGHGKTVAATQIARAAAEAGASVGYVSIEMTWRDLADRIVATYGIPYSQVQSGHVEAQYEERFREALATVAGFKLVVVDNPRIDAAGIWAHTRLLGFDFLIIDHLHRIPLSAEGQRIDRLEAEIRSLATIAREADIPVLVVAQLRRAEGSRDPNPRPTLFDFRGTGVIEQEASVAYGIWQAVDRKSGRFTGDAELSVLKNRFGSTGKLALRFASAFVRLDLAPGASPSERDEPMGAGPTAAISGGDDPDDPDDEQGEIPWAP